ncbi:MAG: ComF family protein [Rhizobiaceae bacterium]|nr:ComF family protein [Rhizobiaceae bacterium]
MDVSTAISSIGQKLARHSRLLADIVVPPTCLTCDAFVSEQGGCCATCWQQLRFVSKPFCPVLGTPHSVDLGENIHCAEALADPPPFTRLRSVVLYDKLARQLISSLKYGDRTDLGPWLAEWMRAAGNELIEDADLIVPVPLHNKRLLARRFNQSAELARPLAKLSDVPFKPKALVRKKHTQRQVGLTQSQRERNLSGAFIVPEEKKIEVAGKTVLLVDDVYTTGATAKAATRALLRSGADHVDVLVFAKVETELL